MGLFVGPQQIVTADPMVLRQALHLGAVQLAKASPAHGRMEQAGAQPDDQAIARISLAQHLWDGAFHHMQFVAVEVR
ncbi:hypothetical protein D3C80_1738050 [compost metagenome]